MEMEAARGTTTVTVTDPGDDDGGATGAGADPVRLFCTDHGGDGPPLLLLHGLAGHCGEWEALAARFAATHRVIAFDARGSGASTRRPGDVTRAAHVSGVTYGPWRAGSVWPVRTRCWSASRWAASPPC